jgi:hypothetical protein
MATINLGKIKPLWRGDYSAGATYRPLDFVNYNNETYINILESTGNLPTNETYFEKVVQLVGTVQTTGNQTIAGVKTFSSNPISTATQSTNGNSLARRDFVTGLDGQNVKLTGNQTVAGVKNFTTNAQLNGSQVYARSNILGTVSQSSGVPTGAIIERGSNANGEFVKYADGTLICMSEVIFTASGSQYLQCSYNPPVAFINNAKTYFSFVPIDSRVSNKSASYLTESHTVSFGKRSFGINDIRVKLSSTFSNGQELQVQVFVSGRWY